MTKTDFPGGVPADAPTPWALDWCQPWYAPYAELIHQAGLAQAPEASVKNALQGFELSQKLRSVRLIEGQGECKQRDTTQPPFLVHPKLPLQTLPVFVAQAALPEGQAYEAFIFEQGRVPTRNNWHDFFNALMWCHWPQTKATMNRLQATEIAAAGVGSTRGAIRDRLTVFDENGAVLIAPTHVLRPLTQAFKQHDWHAAFTTHRGLWQYATLRIVGHALLEKLMTPRKAHVAHVLPIALDEVSTASSPFDFSAVDHRLALELSIQVNRPAAEHDLLEAKPSAQKKRREKVFLPLPVLGIPKWCEANELASFYTDTRVFRPLI